MANDTLTLTLSSGGDVVIRLRPDLAPGHVERITELFTVANPDKLGVTNAAAGASW